MLVLPSQQRFRRRTEPGRAFKGPTLPVLTLQKQSCNMGPSKQVVSKSLGQSDRCDYETRNADLLLSRVRVQDNFIRSHVETRATRLSSPRISLRNYIAHLYSTFLTKKFVQGGNCNIR